MRYLLVLLLGIGCGLCAQAQAPTRFVDKCLGQWQGTMYIYAQGKLRDSVAVRLSVKPTADPAAWQWKTEYLSAKMPMTKDYTLRLKDADKQVYVTDEGGGIELYDYLFETSGVMLTSSYELVGDTLVFEVTSGKKIDQPKAPVQNYTTANLQRVVFRRVP